MKSNKVLLFLVLTFILSAFSYKFADNRDYLATLFELIDSAKKSIFISHLEYNWDDVTKQIARHLIRAKKRGVNIKIILDDGLDINVKSIRKLQVFGFNARLDGPEIFNHTKLVIVDKKYVLLGSSNFSYMSLQNNNESNVLIEDPEISQIFSKYFYNVFRRRTNAGFKLDTASDTIIPFFDKDYYYTVKDELSKAQKRIFIILYGMNLNSSYVKSLVDILVSKRRQGVDVNILLERSSFDYNLNKINEQAIAFLRKNNINAYLDTPDTITHAKVIVIDNNVILSSSNWGSGPFFRYTSCSVIIKDKKAAEHYINYFNSILTSD